MINLIYLIFLNHFSFLLSSCLVVCLFSTIHCSCFFNCSISNFISSIILSLSFTFCIVFSKCVFNTSSSVLNSCWLYLSNSFLSYSIIVSFCFNWFWIVSSSNVSTTSSSSPFIFKSFVIVLLISDIKSALRFNLAFAISKLALINRKSFIAV